MKGISNNTVFRKIFVPERRDQAATRAKRRAMVTEAERRGRRCWDLNTVVMLETTNQAQEKKRTSGVNGGKIDLFHEQAVD